jgi:hypothetical protein
MGIRKNTKGLILSLTFALLHLFSSAQGKSNNTFGSFELNFPKKYMIYEPSDSIQNNMSFKAIIKYNEDSVLVFEDEKLFTQFVLAIRQDIFSLNSPEEFNQKEMGIQLLLEDRDVQFVTTDKRLIIADFGPKTATNPSRNYIEIFCYDFSIKRTLVINSSSSDVEWVGNFQEISRKFTRKLFKAVRKGQ